MMGTRQVALGLLVSGDELCIRLQGDLDLDTLVEVEPVAVALARLRQPRVVLDLSDVSFFGVAAVNFVARLRLRALGVGKHLVVRAPSRTTRRLFDLVGLTDVIEGAQVSPPGAVLGRRMDGHGGDRRTGGSRALAGSDKGGSPSTELGHEPA